MNWMLTDMDSFFASVEQMLRPELRGRPVGVIPVESDGTCVIAASYDAKHRGVKVGMKVPDARRLCPGIRFVKARPDLYVEVHQQILQSVDRCAPVHRVYSIDEWTIRLRGPDQQLDQAQQLARSIKQQLLEDFGPWLTCSIGIAPSRLLAKIASGLRKPDGLTVLSVDDMPGPIEHLSLKSLCGISNGMLARLNKHGIWTVRDLWETSRDQAVRAWGSISGARWWAGFHGIDEPEPPTRRRSMTHGNVLDPRFRNEEGARGILLRLTCKLAQRLRRDGYLAGSMTVSTVDERGGRFDAKVSLPGVNDTPTLLRQFDKLWRQRSWAGAPVKKVDVCVSELVLASQVSRPLFEEPAKLQQVSRIVDQINQRWGSHTVYFGSIHKYRQLMENKIAFGRIPDKAD
jgi:DNA polymerase-4